jgi:hypothetical protein
MNKKEKSMKKCAERSINLTSSQEFEECLNISLENKCAQSEDGGLVDLIYTCSEMKRQILFAFSINQFYNYTNGTANHFHIIL